MNCESFKELMIDVLYGEEIDPRFSFQFFKHLEHCRECHSEYLELLDTRRELSEWSLEEVDLNLADQLKQPARVTLFRRFQWWALLQKTAAAVLILIGLVSILQNTGIWPVERVVVSADELREAVHDMMVASQAEDWKVIGAAMLEMKEEMDARRRFEMKVMYDEMLALEQRYVAALEENNRNLKTILSR